MCWASTLCIGLLRQEMVLATGHGLELDWWCFGILLLLSLSIYIYIYIYVYIYMCNVIHVIISGYVFCDVEHISYNIALRIGYGLLLQTALQASFAGILACRTWKSKIVVP